MTTPKIDIIDEHQGSADAIDTLLAPSSPDLADVKASNGSKADPRVNASKPFPLAPVSAARRAEDDSRIQQLIARWKLPRSLEDYHETAAKSGGTALEWAKSDARKAVASKAASTANANRTARREGKAPLKTAKATGKSYSTVRNVQTAQTLLAQKDRELEAARAELEQAKLENARRTARAEVVTEGEGMDELTAGFSAMLGFLFDGVSELRRLHYAQTARAGGRLELNADEQTAIAAWLLPDEKAKSIARPFAQYLHARMGPEMLELLPLFIGIAGIGGHVLHGVQAERLAKAEHVDIRVVR